MSDRVMVFIDYQNAHFSALQTFLSYGAVPEQAHVHPLLLAERLIARRRYGGQLTQVRVYRGRPSPDRQRRAAAANDRQTAAWERDQRVTVIRRPLWYPANYGQPDCFERPREKGIDVALAVDFVRLALQRRYDVGILVSRDTDLLPALEAIRELQVTSDVHIEVATWTGASRLRYEGENLPWCHYLSREDYEAVRDHTTYADDH